MSQTVEWTFHVWTALSMLQWKPLLHVTLSTLLPISFHFSVCQNKGKSEAKANQIKEFHSRVWSYSTFVHRGRQSSTATSNTNNHAFINICHLYRTVSRLSCEFLDWSVLLSPPDAYRSPHWISAGWCSRCEDATLLPFREQCHISQQVRILQPAWKNQHQPYDLQVK